MEIECLVNGARSGGVYRWHGSTHKGWKIYPDSMRFYIPAGKYRKGQKLSIRMRWKRESRGCSEMLAGWVNGDTANAITVHEIPYVSGGKSLITFSENKFSDRRPRNGNWENIADRDITVKKQLPNSRFKVTYVDTYGWHTIAQSSACDTGLFVNNELQGFQRAHADGRRGWHIGPKEFTFFDGKDRALGVSFHPT